jgi:hypothetical protein
MKLRAILVSDDFSAIFTARGVREDYGVPGSPSWWQAEDIELASFDFLGREIPLAGLPDALEAAILEQADGLEWSPEE